MPTALSKDAALQDIEMLEYLLTTSYAGYDYWREHGVDFNAYFANLRAIVSDKDTVSSEKFEKECIKILTQINDGHIAFIGSAYHQAYRHKSVYYCDIVVEETQKGAFKVIDSQIDGVRVGDYFTENDKRRFLFRTLSPRGKKHYLIGQLSYDPVLVDSLSLNNRTKRIPFHKSRLLFAKFDDRQPFYIERRNSVPVVRATSFANEIYPQMINFMDLAHELKNENTVIVNLMNNGGGSSVFPQTFIKNLNGTTGWETHWAILRSPAITAYFAAFDIDSLSGISPDYRHLIQAHAQLHQRYRKYPVKNWQFGATAVPPEYGDFHGRLILLTNRRVLSAGENMVGASQSVRNRTVIGENTGGVAQFSSSCGYYLPNSKFIVHLPRQLILIPGLEECVGYFPHFWLDTHEPLEEVLDWLDNPDDYQFTYSSSYKDMLKKLSLAPRLPDDVTILPPSAKVPDSLRLFSGTWFGITDGVLDHLLVVEKITDDLKAKAIYAWGIAYQWGINESGWQRFDGAFQNQRLILRNEQSDLTITYTLNADSTLFAVYERPGIYSETILQRVKN